jgi:cholinesterase
MGSFGVAMGLIGHSFSEDCLSINIWTKPQSGEKSKAVLLWIYGGAFSVGSSNASYYDGARLANDEDIIVASIKYDQLHLFEHFPH